MPVFESTEKMYDILGTLFKKMMADPVMGQKFREAQISVRFNIFEPTGTIWLKTDGEVICGSADFKPTIEMTLSGDSCHRFWLKELSLPVAIAKREIKSKGPLPKILKLLPMLKPAYEMYPDLARENGLEIKKA